MRFLGRSAAVMAAVGLAGGVVAACPGVASAAQANQESAARSAGATDPLRIGSIVEQAELTAADGAPGDSLGSSVAVSGDTLVAGAPGARVGGNFAQGAVYVFRHSASGWTQEAKLTAADGTQAAELGSSVAISHGTIFAGAAGDNGALGAVYVFTGEGSRWSQQAKLTASDGNSDGEDGLGLSVAASANTVVAGAPEETVGDNGEQGAAYVFMREGSRWSQEAKLTAADGATFDQLGWSVGISGDKVVAGTLSAGDAYVFAQRGGSWHQEAKLTDPGGNENDQFGQSVAISGNMVAAGAPGPTFGDNRGQGAAYVFRQAGPSWTEQAKLTAPDGAPGDAFGLSLAISRRTLVVGAPFAAVNGVSSQGPSAEGAAYGFSRVGSGWTQQAKVTATDGGLFGYSVGVSDGTIVAGAYAATINGNFSQGAAHVYQLRP